MSQWRDRVSGIDGVLRQDLVHDGDHLTLHTFQDVGRILDDNSRLRSLGSNPRAQGFVAARVPEVLYWIEWPSEFEKVFGWHPKRPPENIPRREANKIWRDFFVRKLHERDYSKLRTDERSFAVEKVI